LGAELTHLGYEKGDPAGRGTGNNRNGGYAKTVLTEDGAVELDVPRDRNGSFEPQIVPKGDIRLDPPAARSARDVLTFARRYLPAFADQYPADPPIPVAPVLHRQLFDRHRQRRLIIAERTAALRRPRSADSPYRYRVPRSVVASPHAQRMHLRKRPAISFKRFLQVHLVER
jgi:hypothetical protein